MEADRPHSRARLAGLLWGDRSDAARQSLRQALYSLKTVAGGALHDCLVTDRELVKFVPQPGVEIDVHRRLAGAPGAAPPEFLEGLAFEACDEFEAWLTATRERFRALAARNSGSLRHGQNGSAPEAGEAEPLVRAARAAERVYAFGNALELYDAALSVLKTAAPASPERYAEVLLLKEAVLERLGRRAEQAATIGETIAVVESLGDPARLATVLLRQAGACAYLGNSAEAVAAARRALELYRAIPDRPGEAEALRELGFAHWRAGDYPAALQFARQALELHRRLGDVAGEASALHNLAEIHRGLGSPRQALEGYEQALQLHWSARSHEGEILTLFGMANALQQAGDLAASRQKYQQALDLSARHGERTMQSRALHALAMQSVDTDLDESLDLMQRAVDVDRAIGYAHALGHDLLDLAHLHWLRGERVEARAAVQEALVWFRYTEDGEALATARAQLQSLDNGAAMALPQRRQWVKSHLALGEGKVYCEFESPLGGMRHRGA